MIMKTTNKMDSKAVRSYAYDHDSRELVTSATKVLYSSETKLADKILKLHDLGMPWTFPISPASKSGESTCTPEAWLMLKADTLSGFPKREQDLVNADIKTLDEPQKEERRYIIQKVGRYMDRIKSELKKIQEPTQPKKTGAKQSKPKESPIVTHREQINAMLKDIENNPDDYPINRTQYGALLNQCQIVLSKLTK